MNPFKAYAAFVANISPKVKGGLIWGTLTTFVIGFLNAIQPADLAWAGQWEPVLFAAIPLVVAHVAAWTKADPLRAEGQKSLALKAAAAAPATDPTAPPAA